MSTRGLSIQSLPDSPTVVSFRLKTIGYLEAFFQGLPSRPGVRLAGVAAVCSVASVVGILLGRCPPQTDVLWPPNGILLAILLGARRGDWGGYLLCGAVVNLFAHLAFHFAIVPSLIFSIANTVEILVAAMLLRWNGDRRPDLSEPRTLLRFVLCAVLLAPLCSGAVVWVLEGIFAKFPHLLGLRSWYVGDVLGIAIMTPLVLATQWGDLADLLVKGKTLQTVGLLTGCLILSYAVFGQNSYPLTFLLFPMLMLVTIALGSVGSAVGIFLMAIPAAYFTTTSRGPLALLREPNLLHSILLLQGLFLALIGLAYAVGAVLAKRRRLGEELADAYHRMELLAWIDVLTGLPNRRVFDQLFSREWKRSVREQSPLSILMVDVDRFKRYNDLYGHIAGDSCLQNVANALSQSVKRGNDVVARYGGEEFAVILPNTDADGALQTAERLCDAVRLSAAEVAGQVWKPVTVSIGVATTMPQTGPGQISLLEAADAALYEAKRNGRDQIQVWQDERHG